MIKVIEFTKEELYKQVEEGKTDIDFMIDYIVKINEVYNKLIDRVIELEGKLEMIGGSNENS